MGENSGIQWTTHTFNPWVGCDKVSPGCDHCYAEVYDRRVGGGIDPDNGAKKLRWGKDAPRPQTAPSNWKKPINWNNAAKLKGVRARVFCASLADVFELNPKVVKARTELFRLIMRTPWLDWQMLTKRPKNIVPILRAHCIAAAETPGESALHAFLHGWLTDKVPANVWGGTTVEDQERADERVNALQRAPFAVRFLSCEPLIGPVDLLQVVDQTRPGIDWVIVGGESGGQDKVRPLQVEWARDLLRQGHRLGAAVFMKQMGSLAFDNGHRVRLADPHGGEVYEWPKLAGGWPREFPASKGGA